MLCSVVPAARRPSTTAQPARHPAARVTGRMTQRAAAFSRAHPRPHHRGHTQGPEPAAPQEIGPSPLPRPPAAAAVASAAIFGRVRMPWAQPLAPALPPPRAPAPPPPPAPSTASAGEPAAAAAAAAAAATQAEEAAAWLGGHCWVLQGQSPQALLKLAQLAIAREVAPGEVLQPAGAAAASVFVVRSGALDASPAAAAGGRASSAGRAAAARAGDVLLWCEALLSRPAPAALRGAAGAASATCRCGARGGALVWELPAAALRALLAEEGQMALDVAARLGQRACDDLERAAAALREEELRRRHLEPYLVPTPKVGIVGPSKYAAKLRKQVVAAARDPQRRAVLVVGEPGMCPDHVAALTHYGSTACTGAIAEVDCARVLREGELTSRVFGRGASPGLLHWLGEGGTLLVNNAHMAPPAFLERLRHLLAPADGGGCSSGAACAGTAACSAAGRCCGGGASASCPRVLLAAAATLPALEGVADVISVPPLRLRPADAVALERLYLRRAARERGARGGVELALTADAERHLQAYGFPGGKQELQAAISSAVSSSLDNHPRAAATLDTAGGAAGGGAAAAAAAPPPAIGRDAFWGLEARRGDAFKFDLLAAAPWLRALLRSDAWPEALNHGFSKHAFGVMLLGLVLGPQDRGHNGFLNLFWDWWWPGIFLAYPFVGRLWCSVCPFMIWGEVAQRWRTSQAGAKLAKWPKEQMEAWGGWALLGMFAGILVWEEVCDLPHSGGQSAALLLMITAGAVASSLMFEKRMWCRYLCPVGGTNGLMAKLAMVEVRGRQGVCSANCSSYSCIKGGQGEGDSRPTDGCPMQYHSAKLQDNSSCIMCMTCLKACPNGSVELRVRPPGMDLWTTHVPSWPEVSLMFLLLGGAFLHRLPGIAAQLGVDADALCSRPGHIIASAAVLAAPGLLAWAADAAGRAAARAPAAGGNSTAAARAAPREPAPFLSLAYGYLPLVWGGTLATYENQLMQEGGLVLQAFAHTLGLHGLAPHLPAAAAGAGAGALVQGATLAASAVLSLALTRKLARAPWPATAAQGFMTLAFATELWHLVLLA